MRKPTRRSHIPQPRKPTVRRTLPAHGAVTPESRRAVADVFETLLDGDADAVAVAVNAAVAFPILHVTRTSAEMLSLIVANLYTERPGREQVEAHLATAREMYPTILADDTLAAAPGVLRDVMNAVFGGKVANRSEVSPATFFLTAAILGAATAQMTYDTRAEQTALIENALGVLDNPPVAGERVAIAPE